MQPADQQFYLKKLLQMDFSVALVSTGFFKMILTKKTLTETEDKLMIYHAFWSIFLIF